MKLGDTVEITECHSAPEAVGQQAKIIAQLDPELAKYPFQVKLLTGKHEGAVLGFREDELKLYKAPKGNEGIPEAFLEEGQAEDDKEPA